MSLFVSPPVSVSLSLRLSVSLPMRPVTLLFPWSGVTRPSMPPRGLTSQVGPWPWVWTGGDCLLACSRGSAVCKTHPCLPVLGVGSSLFPGFREGPSPIRPTPCPLGGPGDQLPCTEGHPGPHPLLPWPTVSGQLPAQRNRCPDPVSRWQAGKRAEGWPGRRADLSRGRCPLALAPRGPGTSPACPRPAPDSPLSGYQFNRDF